MIAVVTGATSGIGAAVAAALLDRGDTVIGVGRSRQALDELADRWGGRFVPLEVDLHDAERVVAALDDIVRRHGRVDLLVNNAGVAEARAIADSAPAFVRDTLDVNLVAPAATIHALWGSLVAAEGCIVNISSLAQLDPFPGFFAYAASKAGLHLLTVVAAAEGRDAGVRAFTLAPGVVDTPLHRSMMPDSIAPVNGVQSVLAPADVARVVLEIIDGKHDSHNGLCLAMPAPAAVDDIGAWVESHPGGGVVIVQ